MAYIATYIVLVLAFVARALYVKRKSKPGSYYYYPENTWSKTFFLPLSFVLLMYIIYPHDKFVRGGIKTEVVKKLETETILVESIYKHSVNRTGTTTFWWWEPLGGHSERYLEITNKIDSTKIRVENFLSIENYEFKNINHEQ